MENQSNEITTLLDACINGESNASKRLFQDIYLELRSIAKSTRSRWSGDYTVNTTALVHEAYFKINPERKPYKNRNHFYATAASAMRHILVNYAEKKYAIKRSRDEESDDRMCSPSTTLEEIIYIDQLITKLQHNRQRHSQIVECRVFAGMTIDETARALDISVSTVKREWSLVSAWLYRELFTKSKQD